MLRKQEDKDPETDTPVARNAPPSAEVSAKTVARRGSSANLNQLFDTHVQSFAGEPAYYFRNARSTVEGGGYMSLTFIELQIERDSWVNVLKREGIEEEDLVIVCLGNGPLLVSIFYALLKIGASAVYLEPNATFKRHSDWIARLSATALIGTPRSVAVLGKTTRMGMNGKRCHIEIADPMRRWGSRSMAARADVARNSSNSESVTFVTERAKGLPPKLLGFRQSKLVSLVSEFRTRFKTSPSELDLPVNKLFALLNPALGMGSAIVDPEGDGRIGALETGLLAEAIRKLKVTSCTARSIVWKQLVTYCGNKGFELASLRRAIVGDKRLEADLIGAVLEIAPNARIHKLYSTTEQPLIASLRLSDLDTSAIEDRRLASRCLGMAFGESRVSVEPLDFVSASEAHNGKDHELPLFGEIVVRDVVRDPLSGQILEGDGSADFERLSRTGDIGYFDHEGRLWYAGNKWDLVNTKIGIFYPDRCESVFDGHPDVARSVLVPFRKRKEMRAAVIIETKPGKYPKKARDRSRFKAELMQYGLATPETKRLLDFFFVKSIPGLGEGIENIDRLALSRKLVKRWWLF